MLASLPDFFTAYWMYLAVAAVVLGVLCFFSEKFFGYCKRALLIALVVFAAAALYELGTGKSLFSLPGSIERRLSEDPKEVETGRRYYKSYEERFGDSPPKE